MMLREHIKGLCVTSFLLAIAGLVLMFTSVSFGTSLGDAWLFSQQDGIADTDQYMMVIETFKNNFVITGSILFGVGLLTAILTYFVFIFYGIKGVVEIED